MNRTAATARGSAARMHHEPGGQQPSARLRQARLALPPLVMLAMAMWRISGASFWRDEAATLSAVRRPAPVLLHFLSKTDVVHGFYDLLMWPTIRILGTSELAVRLPSAVAVTMAATGVAAITARLASERAGLAAGLAFAVLPVSSRYSQEMRSYGAVMACAVLASYLFVRATAADPGSRRWWIGYAAAIAACGWLNLMSLLIIPAHWISLKRIGREDRAQPAELDAHKRVVRSWLLAVLAALIAVSPLLVLAWMQRHGTTRFLSDTNIGTWASTASRLTGSWPVLIAVLPLVVLVLRFRANSPAVRLAVPWLLLPPVTLLVIGTFTPIYDPRYVLFCVPAVAIVVGVGLDALAGRTARWAEARNAARPPAGRFVTAVSGPVASVAIGSAVLGLIGYHAQLAQRGSAGHGDNIRLAAQIVARNEHAGDAVLYQPPWWRQINAAYPYGFDRLRDLSLATTPAQAGNFTGVQLTAPQIRTRLGDVQRVWVVEFRVFRPSVVLGSGWTMLARWQAGTLVLSLYQHQR